MPRQAVKIIIGSIFAICISLTIKNFPNFSLILPLKHEKQKVLKYASFCDWNWNINGNLRTVDRVLFRLGFKTVNATAGDDWDIFWSVEYPFSPMYPAAKRVVSQLKPHQRVNHIPGIGWIVDKKTLSSQNRDIKAVIPGFDFPSQIQEFQEFVKKNPTKKFVEKNLGNRGIKIASIDQVNYNATRKFYQVFLDNPLLVDGHAMDFSIFVLISSIEPLRVYRFDTEVHVRFCMEPYHPFNASNVNQYVVSDIRKSPADMPSLKNYFDIYGASYKSAVESYLRDKECNITKLWQKIDEAIVHVVRKAEPKMLKYVRAIELNQIIKSNFFIR